MSEAEPSETLAEGSLISHLLELRNRLLRGVIAVVVTFVPCAYFQDQLFDWLAKPLALKLKVPLIATDPMAPFMAPLKLALFVALFIAMPYVLYQVWAFVAPGLYRHEKRFAVPLGISSVVLFYAGVAFAYFVVFPLMFTFLSGAGPTALQYQPDITKYLDLVVVLFLAFGVAFEIPVATVLLASTGLVKVEAMTKNRGYVLLGIFIVAAFLTPPDALSQSFMAVPMYLLYECGIVMSRLLLKDRLARQRAEAEEEQKAQG